MSVWGEARREREREGERERERDRERERERESTLKRNRLKPTWERNLRVYSGALNPRFVLTTAVMRALSLCSIEGDVTIINGSSTPTTLRQRYHEV